jgi:TPR repeat protein
VAQLGEMYYYGCYVTQSFEQAFELFKKAAEASNNASGDAMYMLSNCYRFGRGTTQDLEKAEYWLKKSQEAGNDKANIIKQLLGQ